MKKLLVILVLMVYGLSSSGMTLHFHYCCGQLEKIDLVPAKKSGCENGHKNLHSKPCCENKSVELKVNSDQKVTSISLNNLESPSLPVRETALVPDVNYQVKAPIPNSGPPLLYSPSLIVLNCVFRI